MSYIFSEDLILFLKFYIFMCAGVLPMSVPISLYMFGAHRDQKAVRSPGTGIIGDCKPSCGC